MMSSRRSYHSLNLCGPLLDQVEDDRDRTIAQRVDGLKSDEAGDEDNGRERGNGDPREKCLSCQLVLRDD